MADVDPVAAALPFPALKEGEWISPARKGYWMKCCDCGLVHRMRFRLIKNRYGHGRKIQFQAFRVEGTAYESASGDSHSGPEVGRNRDIERQNDR